MSEQARIYYAGLSDQGMIRADNQDSFGKFPEESLDFSHPKGLLFIVADGMGGHKGGKQASEIAVNTIREFYFDDENPDVRLCLERAFKKANDAIRARSADDPDLANMGTTCSTLVLRNNNAAIAHIGDSRIYRITKSSMEQLTDDHSTVAEMVRRGIITKEEAQVHPERSRLYRALGVREDVEIDIVDDIKVGRNEFFLLCTDGLLNHVPEDEIKKTVLQYRPEEAASRLVQMANDAGGSDNITVQIIHINPTDSFITKLFGTK